MGLSDLNLETLSNLGLNFELISKIKVKVKCAMKSKNVQQQTKVKFDPYFQSIPSTVATHRVRNRTFVFLIGKYILVEYEMSAS